MGRPLLIDTDLGVDDAIAILMCLRGGRVAAITTVGGNVRVEQATRNVSTPQQFLFAKDCKTKTYCTKVHAVLKVAGLAGRIPVYQGASEPMVGAFDSSKHWSGHGNDGIGDSGLSEEFSDLKLDEMPHAALSIIDLARKHKELEVLALGPLTNLALALKLDPTIATSISHVTMMGGTMEAKGNSTAAAEFNFDFDPEAAHVVMEAFSPERLLLQKEEPALTLVTWELTLNHCLDWVFFDSLTPPANLTAHGDFLKKICKPMETMLRSDETPLGFLPCDAYASAVMEKKEIITNYQDLKCRIELSGSQTRGMTVMDWYGKWKCKPNVRLVKEINKEAFCELMADTFCNKGC